MSSHASSSNRRRKDDYKRQIYSTDFCIAGMRNPNPQPKQVDLPPVFRYNQYLEPTEFFLGENLNKSKKKEEARATSRRAPRKNEGKSSITSLPTDYASGRNSVVGLQSYSSNQKIENEIMTQSELLDAVFPESSLSGYIESGASTYDAIRPLFDDNGLFAFPPPHNNKNLFLIKTSRVAFRTEYLDYPISTIEKLSLFMVLVRGNQCVSNIVELELKPTRSGSWRPITFHEFDWLVSSDIDVTLYLEIVASVRVPSPNQPFALRRGCIGEGKMNFVEFRKGYFRPAQEGKVRLQLTRQGQRPADGQELAVSFHINESKPHYPNLPADFVCPTEAAGTFAKMRAYLMEVYDPYFGKYDRWHSQMIEPVLFGDICSSEKALYLLIHAWDHKTIESLLTFIRRIHLCTYVTPKHGNYSLLPNADTQERATIRVGQSLIKGRVEPDEKYKPFHSDEHRKPLVLWNITPVD